MFYRFFNTMGNISSWSSWSLAIHFPLGEWQTRLRKTIQQFDRTNSSSLWRGEQSTSLYTIANVRDVRGRAPLSFSLSLCLYYLVASSHAAFVTTPRNITTERSKTLPKRENDTARGKRCRKANATDRPPLRRLRFSSSEKPAPQFVVEIFGSV